MSLLGITPEQPQQRGPSALDNAAKVLGIVGSVANVGLGAYNANTAATNAATTQQYVNSLPQPVGGASSPALTSSQPPPGMNLRPKLGISNIDTLGR